MVFIERWSLDTIKLILVFAGFTVHSVMQTQSFLADAPGLLCLPSFRLPQCLPQSVETLTLAENEVADLNEVCTS